MANLKLVDKRGKEIVELKLQVLAWLKRVVVDDPKRKLAVTMVGCATLARRNTGICAVQEKYTK